MKYQQLTEQESTRLLKLSRAKLVDYIDQLTVDNEILKKRSFPLVIKNVGKELTHIRNDLAWLAVRLIELGGATRTTYERFSKQRDGLWS